jgi:hypothetical protein
MKGDGAGVLLIILAIIVVAIIILGLFFGVLLTVAFISRSVNRHMHVLRRRRDAESEVVLNYDTTDPEAYEFDATASAPPADEEQALAPTKKMAMQ